MSFQTMVLRKKIDHDNGYIRKTSPSTQSRKVMSAKSRSNSSVPTNGTTTLKTKITLLKRSDVTTPAVASPNKQVRSRPVLSNCSNLVQNCDLKDCHNVLERCQAIRLHLLARRTQREEKQKKEETCGDIEDTKKKVRILADSTVIVEETKTVEPEGYKSDESYSGDNDLSHEQEEQIILRRQFDKFHQQADMCLGRLEEYKVEADTLCERVEKFRLRVMKLLDEDVPKLQQEVHEATIIPQP